jgi:hypothetical protein
MRDQIKFRGQRVSDSLQRTPAGPGGQVWQTAAKALGSISQRLGRIADRTAAAEGEQAGLKAGMDPEFRPRRDGTIRGAAFDEAGLKTLSTQTDTALREELATLYDANPGDVTGFNTGVADLRKRLIEPLQSRAPELVPIIERDFARAKFGYDRDYARAADQTEREAAAADAVSIMDKRVKDLGRLAYQSGLDETADHVIAGEIDAIREALLVHGPQEAFKFGGADYEADPARSGALGLDDIERQLLKAGEAAAENRIKGAFDRTDGLQAKTAFVEGFRQDFATGDGHASTLGLDQVEGLERYMLQDVRALEADRRAKVAQQRARLTDIRGRLRDYNSTVQAGVPPDMDALNALAGEAARLGGADVVADVNRMVANASIYADALTRPPAAVQAEVTAYRAGLQGGASPEQAERLTMLENALTTLRSGLSKDPLAFAQAQGVTPVIPLDLSEEGAELTLRSRRAQARLVSEHYGVDAGLFTADEKAQIGRLEREDPLQMVPLAGAYIRAAGNDAPRLLADISDAAPDLAHYGGLMLSGGSPAAVADASRGKQMRSENPGVSPVLKDEGTGETTDEIARELLAGPLSRLKGTSARVTKVAEDIYIGRVGLNAPFDGELYERSLQEAAGARFVGGVQFGGAVSDTSRSGGLMGRAKRRTTALAPNWLRADRFDDMFRALTIEDYERAGGAPRTEDGEPVSLADLRRAHVVSIGQDRYALSLKNPDSDDPQFIAGDGADGRYILNAGELQAVISERHPDWVSP